MNVWMKNVGGVGELHEGERSPKEIWLCFPSLSDSLKSNPFIIKEMETQTRLPAAHHDRTGSMGGGAKPTDRDGGHTEARCQSLQRGDSERKRILLFFCSADLASGEKDRLSVCVPFTSAGRHEAAADKVHQRVNLVLPLYYTHYRQSIDSHG